MALRVGINGFGRIGRNVLRASLGVRDVEVVAVNDLPMPEKVLAQLLKYDSNLGILNAEVGFETGALVVNGRKIKILNFKDPAQLPWKDLGIDLVIESTGLFTEREKAALHLSAGAKKVIISAPAKDEDITICMGVNDSLYDPAKHHIISNASCTTNCLAPVAKVLLDNFGIVYGLMTTIHSYTNDQRILDLAHKDVRRARAAALSMIPSTTGAAKAIGLVLPQLKGKMDGLAIRVPTPNVSLVDLTCVVEKDTTVEDLNATFKKAAASGPLSAVLQYEEAELVSKDFNGNPMSSIFDPSLTRVTGKRLVKVFSWYDNEWGYSNRCVDLARLIAKSLQGVTVASQKVGSRG